MSGPSPFFFTFELVLQVHQEMIRAYGGSLGIREPGLVESAVAQGRNAYHYGPSDLFDIASAYAYHWAESQAFLDGNKRTGAATALIFLEMNGVDISRIESDQVYEMMIRIAQRKMGKAELASFLRNKLS